MSSPVGSASSVSPAVCHLAAIAAVVFLEILPTLEDNVVVGLGGRKNFLAGSPTLRAERPNCSGKLELPTARYDQPETDGHEMARSIPFCKAIWLSSILMV